MNDVGQPSWLDSTSNILLSFSMVVTVQEGASLAGNESSEASFTTSAAISVDAGSSRFVAGFDVIGSPLNFSASEFIALIGPRPLPTTQGVLLRAHARIRDVNFLDRYQWFALLVVVVAGVLVSLGLQYVVMRVL